MNGTAINRVSRPREEQQPAEDFQARHEVGGEMQKWHAEFGLAANSLVGTDKFQNSFPEENASGHENEGRLSTWVGRWADS